MVGTLYWISKKRNLKNWSRSLRSIKVCLLLGKVSPNFESKKSDFKLFSIKKMVQICQILKGKNSKSPNFYVNFLQVTKNIKGGFFFLLPYVIICNQNLTKLFSVLLSLRLHHKILERNLARYSPGQQAFHTGGFMLGLQCFFFWVAKFHPFAKDIFKKENSATNQL